VNGQFTWTQWRHFVQPEIMDNHSGSNTTKSEYESTDSVILQSRLFDLGDVPVVQSWWKICCIQNS